MESKLTCPECEGGGYEILDEPPLLGEDETAKDQRITDVKLRCHICNGSGDLLQGEMTEARARAILKAARDRCGGYVNDGGSWETHVPFYRGDKWDYTVKHCVATEFAFKSAVDVQAFLSSPRVCESLDFIFRPKQS